MKHKLLIAGIVIVVIAAAILLMTGPVSKQSVQAYLAIDNHTNVNNKTEAGGGIEAQPVGDLGNEIAEGIVKGDYLSMTGSYVGVSNAYTQYQLCNPKASKDDLDTATNFSVDVTNGDKLSNYYWAVKRNVTYKETEWVSDWQTEDYDKGDANISKPIDKGNNQDITKWKWSWEEWAQDDVLSPGSCLDIRFVGEYPVAFTPKDPAEKQMYLSNLQSKCENVKKGELVKGCLDGKADESSWDKSLMVDNIVTVAGQTFYEYDWWNATWLYRTNYTIVGDGLPDRVQNLTINTAALIAGGKMQAGCEDSRFTDEAGNELVYQREGCDNAATVYMVETPNVPTQNFTISHYYDNAVVGDGSTAVTFRWFANDTELTAASDITPDPDSHTVQTVTNDPTNAWDDDWTTSTGSGSSSGKWNVLVENYSNNGVINAEFVVNYQSAQNCMSDEQLIWCWDYDTSGWNKLYAGTGDSSFVSTNKTGVLNSTCIKAGNPLMTFVSFYRSNSGGCNNDIFIYEAEILFQPTNLPYGIGIEEHGGSTNTMSWSNPVVSPASPQVFPAPSTITFNITWNATGSEPASVWLAADFSGVSRTYTMTNESKVWTVAYTGGAAAGSFTYVFHANMTDGTSNTTGAYTFVISDAPASLNLVINGVANNSVITWPDYSNATAWTNISGTSVIGYCYQETANVSTTCGGLSTGVYSYNAGDWNNVSALIDGDYNTGSDISSAAYKYFYVNYTKPAIATNAYTRLRLAYTEVNTTLPAACWNAFNNTVALAYRAYFNKMSVFCNDGSAFTDVIELIHSNSTFFEEAIAWNMPVTSSPVTLYRNGTEAPNPDLMYFAGGTSYNYTAVLNSANYSAANVSFTQVINQAAPMFNLTSTNGWILNNGMPTTVACNANATSTLYNNGTVVTSPYTTTYTNGTYRYNCTIADTQNFTSWFTSRDLVVSYFVVGACDGIVSTQVIKFDHYSEINLTATENTIPGVTVSIRVPGSTIPGVTYTANYTVPSTEHVLCMYPAWATFDADLFMDYGGTNTSWPQRSYFLTNHTISNATETIYLYALETEKATIVPVTVIGYSGAVMQDAIVVVQRYYPSDNSYKDVAMGRTSATGVANIRLQLYDAWYRFIVEKDGVVLKQFDRMQVSNAIELRLQENVINNYWSVYGKVAGACNYLGATANFTLQCTGADTSGKVQSWNLLAKKMGAVSWESVCDVSGTGSAVTLNCPLGNTTDKQYYYSFRYIASPPFILLSNYINNVVSPFALPLGVSLFVVFVFVLAMALIGIWNPAMSLISGGAGIAFMYWLGLMPPSMLPGVVGAIIFVAILAWRMKT